jgi:hypothetical protein
MFRAVHGNRLRQRSHRAQEIRAHQQRAYRWTFLVSGLQHPKFVRIVEQLTNEGSEKIAAAAQALAA